MHLDDLPDREHVVYTPRVGACGASRRSATRTRSSSSSSRRWRAPAARRSARWAPTRRSRCCPTARACCSTTSSSCSRRSPTRRSTPSARSWSRRSASHDRRRGQPARPAPESCRQIELPFPIIDNDELAKLVHIDDDGDRPEFAAARDLAASTAVAGGGDGAARGARPRARRGVGGDRRRRAHPRALRPRLRRRAGADPVAAAHRRRCTTTSSARRPARRSGSWSRRATRARCTTWRCSSGYGAGAINPYLAFESIEDLIAQGLHGLGGIDPHKAVKNYIKAAGKGVLKVMSKMGISTVASYTGAQVFEAIGLGQELVDEYFTGTVSRLGGVGLDEIAEEVAPPPRASRTPTAPERAGAPRPRARAASTSGAARASTTSSTRRRCSSCSTRRAPSATTSSRSTPTLVDDQSTRARDAARAVRVPRGRAPAGADRRGRAGRARSSSASRPARCRTARSRRRRTRRSPSR